jgi:Glycosyltransferase family 9 (heptosyltransferase)
MGSADESTRMTAWLTTRNRKSAPTASSSHKLRWRLQRAARLLQETRAKRGWKAVTALSARTVLRKVPLLLRNLRAAGRTAKVRAAVAQAREEGALSLPYLAFAVTGGLGDYLVMARFLRDVALQVGDMHFDIFAPDPKLASWAFRNVAGFHAAYHDISFEQALADYDASFRLNQFAVVYADEVRWKSVREHPDLMQLLHNLIQYRPKIDLFVDRHPWLDNFLARTAVFSGATRQNFLQVMGGLPYGGDLLPVPQDSFAVSRVGLRPGGYITVHNGFDTGFVISGRRATKCYPHFGAVVARLKAALPHMRFVQLGTVTSEPITECDLVLLNKTSMDQASALIAQAALHLDNESGLAHLAACVGTRSAVVFGPTPSDYFGYPGNINIDPPVCGNCWWMTRTWMDSCAKGFAAPRCMTEQDPAAVADRILREIVLLPAQFRTALPVPVD